MKRSRSCAGNITPAGLTVVGIGPEEDAIRNLARARGVLEQVAFAGLKTGRELAELLNKHEIMVVPSRWAEPFGIVALEGIACGCVVVGSKDGGLKEAIGPCGVTFANGSVEELVAALRRVLREPELRESLRVDRETHLARFEATSVAQESWRDLREGLAMILLSHPTGNAYIPRNAARAMLEAGVLGEFWTCVNWRPGSALDRVLPPALRAQMARRTFSGIPVERIHTAPFRELGRFAAPRLGLARFTRREADLFSVDAVCTSRSATSPGRFGGPKDLAPFIPERIALLESFRAARERGWERFYDLPRRLLAGGKGHLRRRNGAGTRVGRHAPRDPG